MGNFESTNRMTGTDTNVKLFNLYKPDPPITPTSAEEKIHGQFVNANNDNSETAVRASSMTAVPFDFSPFDILGGCVRKLSLGTWDSRHY